MPTNQTIDFKDPSLIVQWLDTSLRKEKEKYKKCPVVPDIISGQEAAQGWGYVVAGYFLVEESFKALLYVRKKKVPKSHSLSTLFDMFDKCEQKILQEYYTDYKANIGGGIGKFPFETLDDFLLNLDGDQDEHGGHAGSFDWRYFPIEGRQSQEMPWVSVDYIHEIVYGCIRSVEYVITPCIYEPSQYTHSWRMYRKREEKRHHWLFVRMNSDGWDNLGDRLEILWGPDYRGRHDLFLFRGNGLEDKFSEMPDDIELPIVDKRKEIESFDVEEGYRSIGVTFSTPPSMN